MTMFEGKYFYSDESGAVTVDWIVLTAFAVAMALAVVGTMSTQMASTSDNLASTISNVDPSEALGGGKGSTGKSGSKNQDDGSDAGDSGDDGGSKGDKGSKENKGEKSGKKGKDGEKDD